MRLAKEVNVSSSRAPSVTFIISSFRLTAGLRSSGRVSLFLDFVTPTASTITKCSLFSVADGVTFCRSSQFSVRVLLKVILAADVPHEDQAFDGLHVRAGGDHVHRDGDVGIVAISERTENRFRLVHRVGDLAAEMLPSPNSSRTICTISSA